eukprot:10013240-Ditylum_brightwellii.AAC.1
MLIPALLRVPDLKTNRAAQEKLSHHILTFGARTYWKEQKQRVIKWKTQRGRGQESTYLHKD